MTQSIFGGLELLAIGNSGTDQRHPSSVVAESELTTRDPHSGRSPELQALLDEARAKQSRAAADASSPSGAIAAEPELNHPAAADEAGATDEATVTDETGVTGEANLTDRAGVTGEANVTDQAGVTDGAPAGEEPPTRAAANEAAAVVVVPDDHAAEETTPNSARSTVALDRFPARSYPVMVARAAIEAAAAADTARRLPEQSHAGELDSAGHPAELAVSVPTELVATEFFPTESVATRPHPAELDPSAPPPRSRRRALAIAGAAAAAVVAIVAIGVSNGTAQSPTAGQLDSPIGLAVVVSTGLNGSTTQVTVTAPMTTVGGRLVAVVTAADGAVRHLPVLAVLTATGVRPTGSSGRPATPTELTSRTIQQASRSVIATGRTTELQVLATSTVASGRTVVASGTKPAAPITSGTAGPTDANGNTATVVPGITRLTGWILLPTSKVVGTIPRATALSGGRVSSASSPAGGGNAAGNAAEHSAAPVHSTSKGVPAATEPAPSITSSSRSAGPTSAGTTADSTTTAESTSAASTTDATTSTASAPETAATTPTTDTSTADTTTSTATTCTPAGAVGVVLPVPCP